MKNIISYSFILGASLVSTSVYAADEIKLKKACLKDYPEVVGESNPELLAIYSQLCDKKYKDNKNTILIAAAQKFQQIGKNNKALQIVNYLESQNIQSNELTDVKFLSGIGVAYDALNKMRNTEIRYLTQDGTYPVAKNFADAIKNAMPSAELVGKQQEVEANTVKTIKPVRTTTRTSRTSTTSRQVRPTTSPTKSVTPAKPKQPATAVSGSSGQNPFGKL